jgi:predicted secreted protein
MSKYQGNSLQVGIGTTAVASDATPITANLVKAVEISYAADTYESTGAGDCDKSYIAGHKDASIRIDMWDDSAYATLRDLWDGHASSDTVVIFPQGIVTDAPSIAFSGVVTGMTIGVSHDGVTPFSVTFQTSGGVTESTVASS